MNVWIDKSGNECAGHGVNSFTALGNEYIGSQTDAIDDTVSNDDAAWRKFVGRTENGSGVDYQNALTHVPSPDVPELCAGCLSLERGVVQLPSDRSRESP